jgi:hypothetical protein
MSLSQSLSTWTKTITGIFSKEEEEPHINRPFALEHLAFLKLHSIIKDWLVLLSKEETKAQLPDEQVIFFLQSSMDSLKAPLDLFFKLKDKATVAELNAQLKEFRNLQTPYQREKIRIKIPQIIERLKIIKNKVPHPEASNPSGTQETIYFPPEDEKDQVLDSIAQIENEVINLRAHAEELKNKNAITILKKLETETRTARKKLQDTLAA